MTTRERLEAGRGWVRRSALSLVLLSLLCSAWPVSADEKPIDLGSRRELFVDEFLIAKREGVELKLNSPTSREIVMTCDAPWEGSGCGYERLIRDGDKIRMYYVATGLTNADGSKLAGRPVYACYAESSDGIQWVKPDLGLFEFNGSKHNNIVWAAPDLDNFTPFKDPNPKCRKDEIYKAVASGKGGLLAFKSTDGLNWSRMGDKPIISKGYFDTQNNAFWDKTSQRYLCYIRDFHNGVRDIRMSTSTDFRTWTEPQRLDFGGAPDVPLYTNQVEPYYRAPHILVGFPTRYMERKFSPAAMNSLPDPQHRRNRMKFQPRYGTAITDGLFMTSRDGLHFHRWDEAFIRPGPERRDNWLYGDGYQSLGLLEVPNADPTAANELTFYAGEDHWKGPKRLRRFTIRLDGFVSLHAGAKSGEVVTKPFVFAGSELTLNFATSAAGAVRVEVQDLDGTALPGFTLADCDELFGDSIDRRVSWKDKSDLSAYADKPIRLRFVLSDADVYSLQFRKTAQ